MAARLIGKHRIQQEDREILRKKFLAKKDKYEQNNLGDFQCLYPLKRSVDPIHDRIMDRYDRIYLKAKTAYDEATMNKSTSLALRQKREEKTMVNLNLP